MDDETLFTRFQTCTLARADWTHRAHVRIAWMYRRRCSLDEAHVLMRTGIVRLNASHGLVETTTRGYHETMTRAWLAHVGALAARTPEIVDSSAFFDAHGEALLESTMLCYYTRERLLSLEARARFIEPDLSPLPAS